MIASAARASCEVSFNVAVRSTGLSTASPFGTYRDSVSAITETQAFNTFRSQRSRLLGCVFLCLAPIVAGLRFPGLFQFSAQLLFHFEMVPRENVPVRRNQHGCGKRVDLPSLECLSGRIQENWERELFATPACLFQLGQFGVQCGKCLHLAASVLDGQDDKLV